MKNEMDFEKVRFRFLLGAELKVWGVGLCWVLMCMIGSFVVIPVRK